MLGRIISIFLISSFLPSNVCSDYQSDLQLQNLALKVAGAKGSSKERTQRLVTWMNKNFEFTYTDYKKRTVEEIIQRRGGNCAEQARVLWALLEAIDINARWVSEINIQPKNRRRQIVTVGDMAIGDVDLPEGTTIGAIVRQDEVVIPHRSTVIEPDDHVILFVVNKRHIREVEKLFHVGATFL